MIKTIVDAIWLSQREKDHGVYVAGNGVNGRENMNEALQ